MFSSRKSRIDIQDGAGPHRGDAIQRFSQLLARPSASNSACSRRSLSHHSSFAFWMSGSAVGVQSKGAASFACRL